MIHLILICIFSVHIHVYVDFKTVRQQILAYSRTREQYWQKVWNETENGVWGSRVLPIRHSLPTSLLILRKKPIVLQSNILDIYGTAWCPDQILEICFLCHRSTLNYTNLQMAFNEEWNRKGWSFCTGILAVISPTRFPIPWTHARISTTILPTFCIFSFGKIELEFWTLSQTPTAVHTVTAAEMHLQVLD